MSAPIGATHALEQMIWFKENPEIIPDEEYHIRVHDTVNGQCTHKGNYSGRELLDGFMPFNGKMFIYEI